MEASLDTIIEEREVIEEKEELMVSPSSGQNPTRRIAYFIKPTLNSLKESHFDDSYPPLSLFSGNVTSDDGKSLFEVRYNGWLHPQEEWKTWVQHMQPKYEFLWVKAGIDQAIKASTCQIHKNHELVLELSQRWCSKTNTFVFPWGEATITLEDIRVCGGYSVLGDPVFTPLETHELEETEAKLIQVRGMFNKTKSKKVVHKPWMMHFMKNENQLEHEAFLILWLSRFVFPANAPNTILKSVFPIAIHLARGSRIALAPAVLASIYRDLSLLHNKITTMESGIVTLWAPFQLVQNWALKRFPKLKKQFDGTEKGQRVKRVNNNNLKLVLDSAGAINGFLWCPYENSPSLKLYNEKDMWECDNPNIDIELRSFARCLRVSELVGMGCIEQYLPHRVAMQFGMDQDIPGMVSRCNKKDHLICWRNYSEPIMNTNLLTALSCGFQPNVTSRYYDWWKQSKLGKNENPRKGSDSDHHSVVSISSSDHHSVVSISSSDHLSQDSYGPPGFPPKRKRDRWDSDKEDEMSIKKLLSSSSKVRCSEDQDVGNGNNALSCSQSGVHLSSSLVDETAGSMTGRDCGFDESKDVLKGSKGATEDAEMEGVVGGARSASEDANEAKLKIPFCDTNLVNDKEGEGSSSCKVDIPFDLENRIRKLETLFGKLKAAKLGRKLARN